MKRVLDKGILDGHCVVDNLVVLKDGKIDDNPFSKSISTSLASTWILENEPLVKQKLAVTMLGQSLGVHEVDECFDYAVFYFLEKKKREFNPGYWGDETSSTYTLEIYCLSQLPQIVYYYRNRVMERHNKELHLIERDKDSGEAMPKKCISYDVLNNASFDELKNGYGFDEVAEYEELQDILDIDIPEYGEQLCEAKGLVNFDFRNYVYHMFLRGDGMVSLDGKNLTDESLKLISSELGMTPSGLAKVNLLIKDVMKRHPEWFSELPGVLLRLIEARQNGWVPSKEPVKRFYN